MKYIGLTIIMSFYFSLGTLVPPPEPKGLLKEGKLTKREDIYAKYDSLYIKYDSLYIKYDSLFSQYNVLILEIYDIKQSLAEYSQGNRSELVYHKQMIDKQDSINANKVSDLQDRFISFQSAQKIKNKKLERENLYYFERINELEEKLDDLGFPISKSSSKSPTRKFIAYDRAPIPKKPLTPRYPDLCRQAGIEGRVVIEFYIDETGKVDPSSVSVLNSIPCLDQECINEVKKSKWKPARQGKEKVGVYLTKTFNFSLVPG